MKCCGNCRWWEEKYFDDKYYGCNEVNNMNQCEVNSDKMEAMQIMGDDQGVEVVLLTHKDHCCNLHEVSYNAGH